MHRVKRYRPSAAMVVALIALFAATAGTATAAKLITGKMIKNSSITSADVKNSSLLSADFKPGQIPAGAQGPQGGQGPQGDRGPEGERGPSDAFSRQRNFVADANASLIQLDVPAGKYVVMAKGSFDYDGPASISEGSCNLVAGSSSDQQMISAEANLADDDRPVAWNVAHEFAAAGSIVLNCAFPGGWEARNLKLTAIQVGNLTKSTQP